MKRKIKILHLEDMPTDAELVARELRKGKINAEILVVDTKLKFVKALKEFSPDIILSDHSLPTFNSSEALKIVKEEKLSIPFILITATVSEEFAVEVMKQGANDYVLKDRLQRLPNAVMNAYEKHRFEEEGKIYLKNVIENEAMLKEAEKIAHLGSWQTDLETGKSKWSDEAYRVFGFDPGTIEPSYINFLKCVHPDDKDIVETATAAAINTLELQKLNYRVINKDGSFKYIRSEIAVKSNKKKMPVLITGFNHDVTEIELAEQSLKKSEANLRTIFDNSETGYLLLDSHLNILSHNILALEWAKSYLGIQLNEGRSFLPYLHFRQRQEFKDIMSKVLKGDHVEYETKSRNEPATKFYRINLNPVSDKNNKIIGLCMAIQDITRRKRNEEERIKAEMELQAAHKRLLFHVENTPLGFIEWDNRLLVKSWSKRAEEIFGWNEKELVVDETPGKGQVHSEDLPELSAIAEQLLSGKIERNKVQQRNITKDGRVIWCEWFNSVLKDKDGNVNTIMSLVQDINDRKSFEERLAYSESRLKEAQAVAHVGNWEIDLTRNLHSWSDEMYKIFGANKEDFIPSEESFLALIHPHDLNYVKGMIQTSLKTFENASFDFRLQRKSGEIRCGFSEWHFAFDEKGIPLRLFGIIQDVTERKLAEVERTKMVNDLMVRNRDLEQFAYIVSHNLRAPVANILGTTTILNDPGLSGEEKELLNNGLNDSVTRLDNVIKDLNNILQVKHELSEPKEKISFSHLVDDIKISIKNLIELNNIELNCNFSEVDEMITLKSYLHSIFYNLISNSIKYRRQGLPCKIEIKSHKERDKVELIFSDNGMGINLQNRGQQIFGLYKRFHTNIEGKGMGLFMVKTQVETLGGKISIKSEVNKGTEFKIEFEK